MNQLAFITGGVLGWILLNFLWVHWAKGQYPATDYIPNHLVVCTSKKLRPLR